MRVAFDTNILVYAEGLNDTPRRQQARALLRRGPQLTAFLPVQVLGELFSVLVRKGGRTPARARDAILGWRDAFALIETSRSVAISAMDLAGDHGFSIWDAIIVSAAAEAECRLLLSEDMQDGFTWNGVTIANPFAEARHPLLNIMFADADRWNAER
jgi:predicted nucleic acid-binding protein